MQQNLIIIGAGLEAIPIIERAVALGAHVIATDKNPEAPGFAIAHEALISCVYTPQNTVSAVRTWSQKTKKKPHGVLCAAVDAPHTVAAVAQAFGLRAVSPETAALATDKLAMKMRFQERGVAIPWFQQVTNPQELYEYYRKRKETLVLKPVDSRGARGVLRLVYSENPSIDFHWAFHHAIQYSPTQRVMIETYLDGPQVSTESLVVNGVAYTPGFSDRNYELLETLAPHIIENGGQLPSFLPDDTQCAVKDLAGRAALALGIDHGVAKGDMVVHGGKPYVIEIAARLSGGYFCTHEIPWNTGVDFVGNAIRLALDSNLATPKEMEPVFQKGVAQRYIFPTPGKIVAIEGVEQAEAMEGIRTVEIRVHEGDIVPPAISHPARAGVVMGTAPTRDEAVARVEQAVHAIRIITENEFA